MAPVDLSGISIFLPLLSFLLVFVIVFVVLNKTKVIEQKFWELLVAFLVAIVFVSAVGPREYVLAIVPWFSVLLLSMFFLLLIAGFVGSDFLKSTGPTIGKVVIGILVLMFVISAVVVFSNYFAPYLPGSVGGGDPTASRFFNWLYSGRVAGAILLLVVAGAASWILAKSK